MSEATCKQMTLQYIPVKISARGNLCSNCGNPRYGSAPSFNCVIDREPRFCKACFHMRAALRKSGIPRARLDQALRAVSIDTPAAVAQVRIFEHYDDPVRIDRRAKRLHERMEERRRKLAAQSIEPLASYYPYRLNACQGADLVERVHAKVPGYLSQDLRADICQDILLAILTNAISVDDLDLAIQTAIRSTARAYRNRQMLSLDHPAPWSPDGRNLSEMLAAPIEASP